MSFEPSIWKNESKGVSETKNIRVNLRSFVLLIKKY